MPRRAAGWPPWSTPPDRDAPRPRALLHQSRDPTMPKRSLVLASLLSLGALASCAGAGGGAQPSSAAPPAAGGVAADSASAYAAAQGFLAAFDSLQFDAFRGY